MKLEVKAGVVCYVSQLCFESAEEALSNESLTLSNTVQGGSITF